MEAKKRDHADVIGAAGVSLSLKYESFLSVLTHEDCLTGDGDTLSVISLDIVESIGVEETEVIGLDDARIFVEIVGEEFPDIDHVSVHTEEGQIHGGVQWFYRTTELRYVVYFRINAVEDDVVAETVVVREDGLHISVVVVVGGGIHDRDRGGQCPALRNIDLVEEFRRGDGAVPLDEDDIRMILGIEIIGKCTRDLVGLGAYDLQRLAGSALFRRKLDLTFFCQKDQDLFIWETSIREPRMNERSFSAVEKTCEKINETVFHVVEIGSFPYLLTNPFPTENMGIRTIFLPHSIFLFHRKFFKR